MRRILISLGFVFLFEVCSVCVCAQSASIAPTRTHIDALIHDLQDKSAEVRIQAAKTLYGLEAKAAPAAKALVVALGDREYIVREFSRNALTEIGPPAIPHLANILKRDITSKRMLALGRKRARRPSAASVRREVTLKRLLMHGRQKRLLTFEVCSRIGDGPPRKSDVFKGLTPVLFASLSDKDPFVRVAAIRCLWGMGEASCVPQLIIMLEKDKHVAVRHEAVVACITFRNRAVAAIPVLARMVVREYDTLYDNAESLGADAVEALSGIGEPALPALAFIVADDKQRGDIRSKVLCAMRNMTSHAKIDAAAPAICKALLDRDKTVRCNAAATLGNMETADADVRAALLVATKDKIPCVRLEAAESLYRFDPQNPVVLATILPALYDKEATVRGSACFTLKRIGAPVATPTIPRLIGLLSDENGTVRLNAIYALSTMAGQKANIATAIPALKLAANDPNWSIRHAAQDCLKQVK